MEPLSLVDARMKRKANLVNLDRGLLVAQIMFQRKAHILGRFKTKKEAVDARKAGEDKFFGKYR